MEFEALELLERQLYIQLEEGGYCQIICILEGVGRARVTCTGHVHCKYLRLSPGALGQATIKTRSRSSRSSINQPISLMNSSI